jgi:hypothetical protein
MCRCFYIFFDFLAKIKNKIKKNKSKWRSAPYIENAVANTDDDEMIDRDLTNDDDHFASASSFKDAYVCLFFYT